MTLAVHVAALSFRRHSTYRVAVVAAVLENTVVSMLRGLVYIAVVEAAGDLGGFDTSDAMTFAFVSGMIESSFWITAPLDIGERIRSGDVITDLYRPVDFQGWWLANEAGRCAFNLLGKGLPQLLVGLLVFDLATPANVGSAALFVVSLALAVVLAFAWKFTVSLAGFWMLDIRGVVTLAGVLVSVTSGAILPIALLPDALGDALRWLPPASMINTPFELFVGGRPALPLLGAQVAWAVALLAIGRIVLRSAVRKVVVHGG